MTPPRHNEPGQTLFVTVQGVSRTMRFLPRRAVRDSIDFLFALLVAEYGLLVHEYLFMGNHFHMVVTDPGGKISKFLRAFDSILSRQLNALRGGSGKNFEAEPKWPKLTDAAAVVDKAVYTLVNPCAAHLVARLRQWKGCSSLGMEYGKPVRFPRPKCGIWKHTRGPRPKAAGRYPSRGRLEYRGRSRKPEEVSFTLVRPDVMQDLSDVTLRQHILELAGIRERELIQERRKTGQKVLGWRNIFRQRYLEIPKSFRSLFQRRPRVIGRDPARRTAALGRILRFEREYRRAMLAFSAGENVEFPYGTLQMVQRCGVRCASAPP